MSREDVLTSMTEDGMAAFYHPGAVEPFVEIGLVEVEDARPAIVVIEDGEEVARIPFTEVPERAAVAHALGFFPFPVEKVDHS